MFVFAGSVPGLMEIGADVLKLVAGALVLEQSCGVHVTTTNFAKNTLMGNNVPFAQWFQALTAVDKEERLFRRQGVAYAALLTFRRDQEAATEFWTEVVNGKNTETLSGSRHLQRYLMRAFSRKKFTGPNGEKKDTLKIWEEMASVCILCWNHWRRGTLVRNLRSLKGIPKVV